MPSSKEPAAIAVPLPFRCSSDGLTDAVAATLAVSRAVPGEAPVDEAEHQGSQQEPGYGRQGTAFVEGPRHEVHVTGRR